MGPLCVVSSRVLLCMLFACAGETTAAQEAERTRAAELEAARRPRAERLEVATPPNQGREDPSFIEDSRLFPRIFNPPRGWFGPDRGVGEGNGFTLGAGTAAHTVGVFTARALGSMRQSHLIGADSPGPSARDAGSSGHRSRVVSRAPSASTARARTPSSRIRPAWSLRDAGGPDVGRPAPTG